MCVSTTTARSVTFVTRLWLSKTMHIMPAVGSGNTHYTGRNRVQFYFYNIERTTPQTRRQWVCYVKSLLKTAASSLTHPHYHRVLAVVISRARADNIGGDGNAITPGPKDDRCYCVRARAFFFLVLIVHRSRNINGVGRSKVGPTAWTAWRRS